MDNKFCGVDTSAHGNNWGIIKCTFDDNKDPATRFHVDDSGEGDGSVKIHSPVTHRCVTTAGGSSWGLLRAAHDCQNGWAVPKEARFFPHCENCDNNDSSIMNKVHQDSDHVDDAARGVKAQLEKNAGATGYSWEGWTREWDGFKYEKEQSFHNGPFWTSSFDTRRARIDIDCWDIDSTSPDDWLGHFGFEVTRHGDRVYKDGRDIGHHTNFNPGWGGNWFYLWNNGDEWMDLKMTMGFHFGGTRRNQRPDVAPKSWAGFF